MYVIRTYVGDPRLGYYSAGVVTASTIISAGQVVTITLPELPAGQDGFALFRVDSLGTEILIGTTNQSNVTFTDTGFITADNPYVFPPPIQEIPEWLTNPPSVDYTGQVALTTVPIYRNTVEYAEPARDKYGRPLLWNELDSTNNHDPLGRLRLVINGVDVTFLRGVQTVIHGWTDNEPFGDATCEIEFPQITTYERLGEGDLNWFMSWAEVELQLVVAAGVTIVDEGKTYTAGQTVPLFEGLMPEREDILTEDGNSLRFTAMGVLYQLDLYRKPPGFSDVAEDVGTKIAKAINERAVHYGFRGTPCQAFDFGIDTRKSGAWDKLLSGYIQDLLSTTMTSDGKQATLTLKRPRTPLLKWKYTGVSQYSVWAGQPGVTHSLVNDFIAHPNVYYGEGTDENGYHWRNTKYPNLRIDDAPLFPLSPGTAFHPGYTNTGFQEFADEMRVLGYAMRSQDTYLSADVDEVKDVQRRRGILVDGLVGAQTWAAVFEVGSNVGGLDGTYFAPIAYDKKVMPYIYNAQGAIIGPNPYWIPDKVRLETYYNYGDHTSKKDATRSAQQEYNRNSLSGWAGTITLTIDPVQGSRFLIRAGQNISMYGFHGGPLRFHIAQVDRDLTAEPPTVTLTVDSKYRDLMTIAAIMERDHETNNPANRQEVSRRSSSTIVDSIVVWDVESGAGRIPKHAQQAGLWTVMRIPAGERGTVAKTHLRTFSPANEFAAAVFSKPVTDVQLRALLGNPLINTSDGKNPWDKNAAALDDMGYLYAVGGPSNAAGYWPGTAGSDPVTGVMHDDASWYYESTKPPWLWVAVYTSSSCYVDGRLYPGADT